MSLVALAPEKRIYRQSTLILIRMKSRPTLFRTPVRRQRVVGSGHHIKRRLQDSLFLLRRPLKTIFRHAVPEHHLKIEAILSYLNQNSEKTRKGCHKRKQSNFRMFEINTLRKKVKCNTVNLLF